MGDGATYREPIRPVVTLGNGPGSTASRPDPILLMVVGFDGSRSAVNAATYACDLAHRLRRRLLFADLWDANILDGLLAGTLPEREELIAALNADVDAQFAEIVAGRDIDWEVCHAVGDPFDELIAVTTEAHADSVILGGRSAMRRPFSRSVAGRLRRLNRWSVVSVG